VLGRFRPALPLPLQDQQTPPPTPHDPAHRAAWVAAIAISLLVVVAVAAVLVTSSDGQTEGVARLREILRVRDQALHDRNAGLADAALLEHRGMTLLDQPERLGNFPSSSAARNRPVAESSSAIR
jgi:hypothetical protein